jgi:hypothetical protein
MTVLKIVMDATGIIKDVPTEKVIHLTTPITVAALAGGMESGKPSIAFVFELPSGETVLAETSMTLFQTAAKAFAAKFDLKD